ncbi:GntR family transcriptional regulator [Mesorhizobium sp. M0643]|uniref:GntR family transcriptional regulator n=1 Tax=Mesorhizobium sp. M0643 TaxID=2956978 RepID=UPI00333AE22A
MAPTARDKSESTYHRLKELVLNYRFRPGEPLSPISIADRLQVSATPVREALARLHGEDLVGLVSNRGFFAKTLNVNDTVDHYEFAFQILIYGIERRYSQFMVDEKTRKGLSSFNYNTEGCFVYLAKIIEDLYLRIAALTGNRVMLKSIRSFNDQTRFVRLIDLEAQSNFHEIAVDMSALISALERQDMTAAIANLRHQRDKKLARMSDLVSEGIARSLSMTVEQRLG